VRFYFFRGLGKNFGTFFLYSWYWSPNLSVNSWSSSSVVTK
jgi:hypothetical protein